MDCTQGNEGSVSYFAQLFSDAMDVMKNNVFEGYDMVAPNKAGNGALFTLGNF